MSSQLQIFDLNEVLIANILFAMENQETLQVLDLESLSLVNAAEVESLDVDRYLALPLWQSADGFRIMEAFSNTVPIPSLKNELRLCLQRGRGVFRAFKDALQKYQFQEQAWFQFKERQLRRRIGEWYNELRDLWGLEQYNLAEDELDRRQILSEFNIVKAQTHHLSAIEQLDRASFQELFAECSTPEIETIYQRMRQRIGSPLDNQAGNRTVVLETLDGTLAGFCWGQIEKSTQELAICFVVNLFIDQPYRGAGLASSLEAHFREQLASEACNRIWLPIPTSAEGFNRHLLNLGYRTMGAWLVR